MKRGAWIDGYLCGPVTHMQNKVLFRSSQMTNDSGDLRLHTAGTKGQSSESLFADRVAPPARLLDDGLLAWVKDTLQLECWSGSMCHGRDHRAVKVKRHPL